MVRISSPVPNEDTQPTPEPTETPVAPKRRWWKQLLLILLAVVFFGGGWFSYKVAAASSRIFADNNTGGSPLLHGKLPETDTARINILLLGIGGQGHDAPNLADTIQVVSIDPKTHQVAMLSLPRDLYVTQPNSTSKSKINEVYSVGEDDGGKGGALMKDEVAQIIGQPIHYFMRVDFDGFQQIVDAVGGVDINVPTALYDPYYPRGESAGYEILNVKAGQQHMNGALALKYARSRETSSDFDRSRRQQEVLVAVRDKALSLQYLGNPGKISQFIDIAGDHVQTDLSLSELQKLAKIVKDIPQTSVQSKVIDNSNYLYDSVGPGGAYILIPKAGNYSEIRSFVDQLFNGGAVTAEAAQVELQNASGQDGLGAQEQASLTEIGFKIANVATAQQLAQPTVIYDYSDGKKSATIAALKKRYNAQVIKQARATGDTIDIRVIIGSSYLQSSNTAEFQGASQSSSNY